MRIATKCIAAGELDREIETLVENPGERVRRIQPYRRQHGHQFAKKIILDPCLLFRRPLSTPQETDTRRSKRGKELVIQQRVLAFHQLMHVLRNQVKRFARREAVGAARG